MCLSCRGREPAFRPGSVRAPRPVPPVRTRLSGRFSRANLLKGAGASVALMMGAGLLGCTPMQSLSSLPYVVLIVLDGARPEYFNVPGIPTVRRLMRNGTSFSNAFAGILESETPSGHTSIATGSPPYANGILAFWWANSANVEVDLFDPTKVRAGVMEDIVRQAHVPTLAGQVHLHAPRASVVALSGSKYYAADAIGGPDANIIMYFQGIPNGDFVPTFIPGHQPPAGILTDPSLVGRYAHMPLGMENSLAMRLAIKTFERTRQHVTLVNLPEFDWPLGHVDGGVSDPGSVTTLMQSFDRDLAALEDTYRAAGVHDNTIFVLAADHGMMPLTARVDSEELLAAVEKAGTGVVSQTYTSGVYYWLDDSSRAPLAAQQVAALGDPRIQSVYAMDQSRGAYRYHRVSDPGLLRTAGTEAANQYLLQSFAGPNGPDVAVIFTEGVGSEPGGQAHWKADHGGASWQAQHIPLVVSGPGVRANHVSSSPARLIDIAPTVLQLMGASKGRMQGIPLADAMTDAPRWMQQQQHAQARRLLPLVQAMREESRREQV